MTQLFFTEVHLLAGKLVPIVVIHSLGGSRANRHHTPNRNQVPHNQHKMRINKPRAIQQSTFWLFTGKRSRTPHNHHDWSWRQSPTFTQRSSLPQAVQVAATTKSNKRIPQQNTNTKCLQMQTLKQCTWVHSQSHKDDELMMEMSGRALAKLTRLLCQCKWPRE